MEILLPVPGSNMPRLAITWPEFFTNAYVSYELAPEVYSNSWGVEQGEPRLVPEGTKAVETYLANVDWSASAQIASKIDAIAGEDLSLQIGNRFSGDMSRYSSYQVDGGANEYFHFGNIADATGNELLYYNASDEEYALVGYATFTNKNNSNDVRRVKIPYALRYIGSGNGFNVPVPNVTGEYYYSVTLSTDRSILDGIGDSDDETYLVTFDAAGGTVSPASATTGADGRLSSLPIPTKSGYTFDGWFTAPSGGTQVTASYVFAADTTIYARWTEAVARTYLVTFDAAGGTVSPASATTGPDGRLASLPTPTKSGNTFDGWFTAPSGGTQVTASYVFAADATIYAHWTATGGGGGGGGSSPATTDIGETETPLEEAPKQQLPFVDVSPDAWYYDNVRYVYENGLMTGTSDDKFSPGLTLTRAMIVTILWRHAGSPDAEGESAGFSDVEQGSWYEKAVGWAAENGIVLGYGESAFGPGDPITRQDLAAILARYMNFLEVVIPVTVQWIIFADEADISDYAMDAIQTFNKLGVINGIGTNESGQTIVGPKGNATRAQAAAMLHRFLELIEE